MKSGGVRFAPSPTGKFHVGNLRTAWISRKWALALGEPWVVRFEDIDTPRVVAGSKGQQLADMAALGLVPDKVYDQSGRRERHWECFASARESGAIYPCYCSRKEVQEALAGAASAPHSEAPIYDGKCREGRARPADFSKPDIAWRFRGEHPSGAQDFIVARTAVSCAATPLRELRGVESSFVPAYHWACAIDDFDGGYSLLVRAWDLRSATDQQRAIQRHLGATKLPAVFHTSLVVASDGSRLEKRTRGVTLEGLVASGVSTSTLSSKFEKSFSLAVDAFAQSKIWGEAREKISLAELGL